MCLMLGSHYDFGQNSHLGWKMSLGFRFLISNFCVLSYNTPLNGL